MLRLRLFQEFNSTALRLEPEIDYLIESQMLGVIAMGADGNLEAERVEVHRRNCDVPSGILVLRSGGAGDILFLTPALKALRERFPAAHICVASREPHHWILANSGLMDSQNDFPIKTATLGRFDWILDLEHSIEKCHDRHAIDIFANKLCVKLQDRATTYRPATDPSEFEKELPKTKKRIAVQLAASSPVRTYPRVMELQTALRALDWEVAICCAPGHLTIRTPIEGLVNIGAMGWPWQKSTDFLKTCDFVIGPDSSVIHFAGAMGIPGIGLYGSFEAKYRLIEDGSIQAIQATRECPHAPCFYHNGLGQFPSNGPCATAKLCTTLATISPEEIIAKMAAMGF